MSTPRKGSGQPAAKSLPHAQSSLEDAICNGDYMATAAALFHGADPLAFPAFRLKTDRPKLLCMRAAEAVAPGFENGQMSLLALIALNKLSYSNGAFKYAMTKMEGRKFEGIPRAIKGRVSMDMIQLFSSKHMMEHLTGQFSPDGLSGIRPFQLIVKPFIDGLDINAPKVMDRLSALAVRSLKFSKIECEAETSEHVHETLGFQVFADLLLRGVPFDPKKLPSTVCEFKLAAPFIVAALHHGMSSKAPKARDDLMLKLIDMGVSVNTPVQSNGQTPLMWATGMSDARAVKILIDAGADLHAKDSRNWTARSLAQSLTKSGKGSNQRSISAAGNVAAMLDAARAYELVNKAMQDAHFVSTSSPSSSPALR